MKAYAEIRNLMDGERESPFEIVSGRARNANQLQLQRFNRAIHDGQLFEINRTVFGSLAELIDTYQTELKR